MSLNIWSICKESTHIGQFGIHSLIYLQTNIEVCQSMAMAVNMQTMPFTKGFSPHRYAVDTRNFRLILFLLHPWYQMRSQRLTTNYPYLLNFLWECPLSKLLWALSMVRQVRYNQLGHILELQTVQICLWQFEQSFSSDQAIFSLLEKTRYHTLYLWHIKGIFDRICLLFGCSTRDSPLLMS